MDSLFRIFAVCAALFAALPVWAEPRLALVIGNSAYGTVGALDNPGPDARLIAASLEETGFDVTLVVDAGRIDLVRAIAQFGRDLRAAGEQTTGLFYYAGHGVQSFGSNFLLPVDADLTDAADLPLVAVEADAVLRQMASAKNRTNIVILDACRNNPFETVPDLNDPGLAEMNAPTGTFLAYAAAPGGVALDGSSGNSPFTKALADRMSTPGLAIEQLFKDVRVSVLDETGGAQVPWDTSSLTGDFVFKASAEPSFGEAQLWASVKDSGDPVQVLLFLRSHPDGVYADQARALLSELVSAETGGSTAEDVAPAEAAPVADAPPPPPAESERDLIAAAQASGALEDYQAYLDAYPEGTYAELAAFEIDILEARNAAPANTPAPAVPEAHATLTFTTPIPEDIGGVSGRSIADLLSSSPHFPPIEGLPEEVWKENTCATCHNWTQDDLCTQGNTYLAETATRALSKSHPFGGAFKRSLRAWADGGCQ